MSRPKSRTVPVATGTSPTMAFTSVDFPEPFGPRTVRISPERTARVAPRTIARPGS